MLRILLHIQDIAADLADAVVWTFDGVYVVGKQMQCCYVTDWMSNDKDVKSKDEDIWLADSYKQTTWKIGPLGSCTVLSKEEGHQPGL